MKKVVIAVVVIILIVIGGIEVVLTMQKSNKDSGESKVSQSAEENKKEDIFMLKTGEKEIKLGEEFSKEKFGEEKDYSEIASCAFEGLDKTYTYDNYEITTFPDGEKERIYSIYFLNEEMETTEGVKLSDGIDKMKNTYGEEYENQGNQYTYKKGKTNLEFIVENDTITSIQYTYTAE